MHFLDHYQYLGNCPPIPPLTQQQSIDIKLGVVLGEGRGRWEVAQILILILLFIINVTSELAGWHGFKLKGGDEHCQRNGYCKNIVQGL